MRPAVLTAEAGPFAGLNVLKDANGAIITALAAAGALLAEQPYEHRYPYDWRTKKPTIFRATEQWFASVEGFRERALEAIATVDWLPASGRNRIEAMVRRPGRLVHLPAAHLGGADPCLLSPPDRRNPAQRRHPGPYPGADRRARLRCVVGAGRSRSAASGLGRPGGAVAQGHRHDGRVVRLRLLLGGVLGGLTDQGDAAAGRSQPCATRRICIWRDPTSTGAGSSRACSPRWR
jgi:hypothetical protein